MALCPPCPLLDSSARHTILVTEEYVVICIMLNGFADGILITFIREKGIDSKCCLKASMGCSEFNSEISPIKCSSSNSFANLDRLKEATDQANPEIPRFAKSLLHHYPP